MPRIYRLVWAVSAATVAASVYISLDMLANSHEYRGESRLRVIALLRQASVELRKHAVVAAHAAKGSAVLQGLLPLLEQHDFDRPRMSYSMQDLLQQLAAADMGVPSDASIITDPGLDGLAHIGDIRNLNMLTELGNTLEGTYGMGDWDEVFSQL